MSLVYKDEEVFQEIFGEAATKVLMKKFGLYERL
jgi:hypothetical protein